MKYQIKSIAQFAGVSVHTLRAWERRYQAVEPQRDQTNGRRLYSEHDAHRVRLLAQLVREGHAIGRIAKESTEHLEKMIRAQSTIETDHTEDPIWQEMYQIVIDGLHQFDFQRLYQALRSLRSQRSVESYVLGVCSPLLRTIGALVGQNELTVAHEHVLSAIVKMELFELYATNSSEPNPSLRSMMFTTSEGDHHEIGILMAAVLAKIRGRKVFYLGPSMPHQALSQAASMAGAGIVVLGFVPGLGGEIGKDPQQFLTHLDTSLDTNIDVWTGGLDRHRITTGGLKQMRDLHFLKNLEEFVDLLQTQG